MFQPFEVFKHMYIPRLQSLKKIYLVSQSYSRGIDASAEDRKTPILLTDYEDIGLAKIHLNAVKEDQYASIIDISYWAHINKIRDMLAPESKYEVFWSIVRDVREMEQRLNKIYVEHMRRYIMANTNWRIGAGEHIYPTFEVTFGELFVKLKRGTQQLRVKFEEIENS